MVRDSIFAFLISFIIAAALCPLAIPVLHKMKFGQQVREDGPQKHLKKSGTPTMGGIVILLAFACGTMFFVRTYPLILPVLVFTLAYGFIGFLDDYLKILKKTSEGLSVLQKLSMQLILTGGFAVYLYRFNIGKDMLLPFGGGMDTGYTIRFGALFIPAVFFIVLGTDNGVNFTDGLDGLCSAVTIAVSFFFAAAAWKEGIMVSPVAGAMMGALTGFLIYNAYPAKVFMGDTGSLALGGFVSSLAIIMRMPLFIVIVGFIYLIEVLSVMIQVAYFKKTGGKRFFKMAPIHHHFELCGWSETRVVTVFTILTVVLSLLAYIGLR